MNRELRNLLIVALISALLTGASSFAFKTGGKFVQLIVSDGTMQQDIKDIKTNLSESQANLQEHIALSSKNFQNIQLKYNYLENQLYWQSVSGNTRKPPVPPVPDEKSKRVIAGELEGEYN